MKSRLLQLLFRLGLFELMHALWPQRLTVLAYHRIADPDQPGFDTFKPNVSATPSAFAEQMDFMRRRFNIVPVADVVAWLQGQGTLPPRPALITFDDGYRDNFEHALPVLRQRDLPAVIFLATDYIDQDTPFFWDLIAYCFCHTSQTEVDLPLIGRQHWHDEKSRSKVERRWLDRLKEIPDQEKWSAIEQLPGLLGLTVPTDAFAGLHLTWDQVRAMVAAGLEMGAHTQSHPILTRISMTQARVEVTASKERIESEIGRPVTTFAYTNGQSSDFSPEIEALLHQANIRAAFTLLSGPTALAEAKRSPLAIRRIFIHHADRLPRFAAKVMGLPRLMGSP